jgi:ribonuclease G
MSEKLLIINKSPSEVRVAVVENGVLTSLQIERVHERGMVGNIYKGRVTRVLPGMQSAFVEIGAERTAFLYGGDIVDPLFIERKKKELEYDELTLTQSDAAESLPRTPIENLIHEGQEIVVQVTKDPLGTKGARLTTFLAIPGRYVVLLPEFTHVGVSRRISNEEDRERLRNELTKVKPPEYGAIVRTAALEVGPDELQKDIRFLVKVWHSVKSKIRDLSVPSLVYHEPDLHIRATRELYTDDITGILIDEKDAFAELSRFLGANIPSASSKLFLHEKKTPIFDEFGLEVDLAKALGRKVWLPSGGYVVVDQTEALTTFDVNTGKFVGKISARETILKTNLEAAEVIAAQLRIRNIGGIIVIDFIDMDEESDRKQVEDKLQECLKPDKAKTTVLKMSELGLVQMTRKRTSESIQQKLTDTCILCDGIGRIKSPQTEVYDLIRDVERYIVRTGSKFITVKARPDLKRLLEGVEKPLISYIVRKHKIKIQIEASGIDLDSLKEAAYEVVGSAASDRGE